MLSAARKPTHQAGDCGGERPRAAKQQWFVAGASPLAIVSSRRVGKPKAEVGDSGGEKARRPTAARR